jgi:hypothetical protein
LQLQTRNIDQINEGYPIGEGFAYRADALAAEFVQVGYGFLILSRCAVGTPPFPRFCDDAQLAAYL